MKTSIMTKEVAYATFQGVLLFPVFPAVSSAQKHELFKFKAEKSNIDVVVTTGPVTISRRDFYCG
jgi:hypothetical protein